jgi:hypothetical protein
MFKQNDRKTLFDMSGLKPWIGFGDIGLEQKMAGGVRRHGKSS